MFEYHLALTIIVPSLISILATLLAIKFISYYFTDAGIIAEDMNKKSKPKLPGSGGVAVAFGIISGILAYTFGGSFIFTPILDISNLLAVSLSIMLIAFVGFMDDINVRKTPGNATGIKDIRKGLKQWQKPLLTLLGAFPLMALNVGTSVIHLPFIGIISLGIIYPLIIIPLAVIFTSSAYNLLGGFNGLESGMGFIAAIGFLIYSIFLGNGIGILISALLVASLFIFLIFNAYPAKILPGDSLTYCIGGAFVCIMVMGGAEEFGLIVFIPWIIEFFLHLKGKFSTTDLGKLQNDGTLKAPYGKKIFSLTHIAMNLKKTKEWEVSAMLWITELVFVVFALIITLH
jgi:UDP-N-acetylglucosamine--dolichyl-phosphate N-acetylglucosaminephosphotransferase